MTAVLGSQDKRKIFIPIILSAKSEDYDKIQGLDI